MKSQLIGKPLEESTILAMQCKEIFYLKNTKQQPVPMLTVLGAAVGQDVELVTAAAIAMLRLRTAGKVDFAIFGERVFIKLASTADEAQGSTSRLAAGGVTCGSNIERTGEAVASIRHASELVTSQEGETALPVPAGNDFSILSRPHIVRKKEEVHVELCHECERMASGHCDCGLPVCSAHRYSSDGERNPHGMCGKCQKEIFSDVEIFNSCGRQV
jgi:hypothetical protein